MTRTNAREIAMRLTFELGFSSETAQALLERELTPERFELLGGEDPLYGEFPNAKQKAYITELVKGVLAHGAELDSYIEKYAVGWRFHRIDRVAAAIMRLSMYEVLYRPDIPNRAAVNEAVEIAKGYLDAEVVRFINGILGTFVRAEFPDRPPQPSKKQAGGLEAESLRDPEETAAGSARPQEEGAAGSAEASGAVPDRAPEEG